MLDILLVVQIVIGALLITVILLQKTGADGFLGSGGGAAGGGIVTAKSAANFFSRATMVLGACFIINSIILANLSGKKKAEHLPIIKEETEKTNSLPMAK